MLEKIKILDKQTKIIAFATFLCIVVTILMGTNAIRFYSQKKITVTAKVSAMEIYYSSHEDDSVSEYNVYVNYSCMGKIYKDVYYKQVPLDTELNEGDKVKVDVYSEDPGEIATNTFVSVWFFLAGSVVLSVISVKKIKEELSHGNAEN